MAHIPEDARYVQPPDDYEVDEDAVTENAVQVIWDCGGCPACGAMDYSNADTWAEQHALDCDKLRERVLDRMAQEGE